MCLCPNHVLAILRRPPDVHVGPIVVEGQVAEFILESLAFQLDLLLLRF